MGQACFVCVHLLTHSSLHRWFGQTQKYSPSNLQDSSAGAEAEASESAAGDDESSPTEGDESSDCAESAHGVFPIDTALSALGEGGDRVDLEGHGLLGEDSADRAERFMQVQEGAQAAASAVVTAEILTSPPSRAITARPPTQAQVRKDKAAAKALEVETTSKRVMDAITANSTSVNTSPKGTFDATYVAVNQAKIAGLVQVETMRSTAAKQLASDELKLSTMKLQFEIETAQSDRMARGIIQTEINVTALLNHNPTGGTARLMMELVDARARANAVAHVHPLSDNIAAFAMSLAAPAPVFAAPAPVPAAPVAASPVAAAAVITINSESSQRQ